MRCRSINPKKPPLEGLAFWFNKRGLRLAKATLIATDKEIPYRRARVPQIKTA